ALTRVRKEWAHLDGVGQYLCKAHGHRAITLTRLGRPVEALDDWEQALALDDGVLAVPLLFYRAETLGKVRQDLLRLARAGDHARASAAAAALARQPRLPPGAWYDLAVAH